MRIRSSARGSRLTENDIRRLRQCGSPNDQLACQEIERCVPVDRLAAKPAGKLVKHQPGGNVGRVDRAPRGASAGLGLGFRDSSGGAVATTLLSNLLPPRFLLVQAVPPECFGRLDWDGEDRARVALLVCVFDVNAVVVVVVESGIVNVTSLKERASTSEFPKLPQAAFGRPSGSYRGGLIRDGVLALKPLPRIIQFSSDPADSRRGQPKHLGNSSGRFTHPMIEIRHRLLNRAETARYTRLVASVAHSTPLTRRVFGQNPLPAGNRC